MSPEHRKYPRVGKPLEAKWRGAAEGSACTIADISWGGCFVQSRAEPAIGEQITVTTVIGDREVTLTGSVIYRELTIGFGIQFDPLSRKQMDVLKDLLGVPPDFLT